MIRRLTAMALFASLTLGAGLPMQASAAGAASVARNAAPVPVAGQSSGQVEQAQYRDRRHWRDDRRWRQRDHRRHYRPGPPPRSGFYFQFGTPPRYAPPPRYRPRHAMRLPISHVRWCESRYRSYRASDNTFQPYNGPRRQCHSPYI